MEKHKVLYVDDEPINLELLKISFRKEYEVITAMSADDGLDILENDPDVKLIISDLRMPIMDGYEFIKAIKKKYEDKICMLLTGYLESEIMSEGINRDLVFRYIVKPWKKDELSQSIEEAFRRLNQ
jgi:two-component system response regulator PhcR